jgi:tRNA-dihydrouridine synthase A
MKNKINVAPMMDWTDRHCRYFMRLLSPTVRLYTEMVTAAALEHRTSHRAAGRWQ